MKKTPPISIARPFSSASKAPRVRLSTTMATVLPRVGGGVLLTLLAACSSSQPTPGDPMGSGGSTAQAGSTSGGSSSGGSGGTAQGGTGASTTGGTSNGGTSNGGSTSSGGSGGTAPTLSGPQGTIPNQDYPESMVEIPREEWESALISPTLESEHHNQPAIINGYLQLTGNSRFSIYDISDPSAPVQLSENVSPEYCADCGPKNEGEAEGHQVSFARYGDDLFTVTINGYGVDVWKITDPALPVHLKSIALEGVNFGDFTEAVWGVYWQGSTIYVGGTNTGLHILDATDPADVTFVKSIPTPSFGNVSAGPLYAVGNILVITTPKESSGIATLDISDPHNPFVLDAISPSPKSYIGAFYNHHVYIRRRCASGTCSAIRPTSAPRTRRSARSRPPTAST